MCAILIFICDKAQKTEKESKMNTITKIKIFTRTVLLDPILVV